MHPARRGTVLLIILAVVALVVVLILSSMAVITTRRAAAEARVASLAARTAAEAGLELALAEAANSYAWRNAVKGGVPFAASDSFPSASFSVTAVDPVDADLASSLNDAVVLTATGLSGTARQMVAITLDPDHTPVTGLACALAAGSDITITSGTVRSQGLIMSNAGITATSSNVLAPAAAVGAISGATYGSTRSAGVPAVQIPSQPWLDYTAIGSVLTYGLTGGQIRNVVLGPSRNPFGPTNVNGIYVVDAAGNDLLLRDCRIFGTLVVLNARTVEVRTCVVMDPVVDGWPVLIVQGNLYLTPLSGDLSESTVGVNFNPVSVPYRGASDADLADTYASSLNGLVYASGNVSSDVGTRCTITGALLVGGKASLTGEFNLRYRASAVSGPPGFRAGSGFGIRPGSWARVVQ